MKRLPLLAAVAAFALSFAAIPLEAQTGATPGRPAAANPGTSAAADPMGYAVSNGTVYAIQGGRAVPVTTVESVRQTPRGSGGIDQRVLNLRPGQMMTPDGRVLVMPKNVTLPAPAPQATPGTPDQPVTPSSGAAPAPPGTAITPRSGNPAAPQSGINAPSNSPSTGTPTRR